MWSYRAGPRKSGDGSFETEIKSSSALYKRPKTGGQVATQAPSPPPKNPIKILG